MVVTRKYGVIDLEKGMLDRSVFVDEQTYQDELEKVFGRAWLMIGHASLIPNPNDFFLSYIGEDPVIITRDSKGELHVFLNMCRHRGNRVVRADDGNAKNFMCTYHGWTFSNERKLVSVPGLQEAYYGELDVEHLGLWRHGARPTPASSSPAGLKMRPVWRRIWVMRGTIWTPGLTGVTQVCRPLARSSGRCRLTGRRR